MSLSQTGPKISNRVGWSVAIVMASGLILGMTISTLYMPEVPDAFFRLLWALMIFLAAAITSYILETINHD